MVSQSLLGLGLTQVRKTTDIHVSQTKNTRIAGSEIPAKCLSMFCHSDILIEKQKCRGLKKNWNAIIRGKCPEDFFWTGFPKHFRLIDKA